MSLGGGMSHFGNFRLRPPHRPSSSTPRRPKRRARREPKVEARIASTTCGMKIAPYCVLDRSKPSGLAKFEGFVLNANIAQITVRAKGTDMSIQTFTLSQQASTKMQQIIDKGGFQYGDKVTVLYDPSSLKAIKVKGKPSPAL